MNSVLSVVKNGSRIAEPVQGTSPQRTPSPQRWKEPDRGRGTGALFRRGRQKDEPVPATPCVAASRFRGPHFVPDAFVP